MEIEALRKEIDKIDAQLKELIMRRMDQSEQVARAKAEAGETAIYRPTASRRFSAVLQREFQKSALLGTSHPSAKL